MALKKEVEAILNRQIELEFDASTVYYGMHIYFEQELFKGFSAWFKHQVAEEMSHAAKLIDYILDRGGSPAIPGTKAPKMKYDSTLAAMKSAMSHEHANTAGIHACLKVAAKVDDPATLEMLHWFVKEQVEEEQWTDEYVQMVEKLQNSIGGMYAFDHAVGKRVTA